MAFSQFPAPAAGGAEVAAFAAELSAKNVTLIQDQAFEAGSYTVNCAPTSTDVTVVFTDATSVLTTQVTVTGTISFTLASPATKVLITAKNTATIFPTIVSIEKTGNSLTSTDIGNGTLDTINATGTYNQTGLLSVLAIGGGSFGLSTQSANAGSPGGAPGNMAFGTVFTNTATTVTVGAKGVARNNTDGSDTAATNSSFGNLIETNTTSTFITRGAGGGGTSSNGNPGNASQTFASFNTTSTNGGGGAGAGANGVAGGAGAGSGIGTGGSGGESSGAGSANHVGNSPGGDATGKGAGGGGGPGKGNNIAAGVNNLGGDGSDGVVYVLRGF